MYKPNGIRIKMHNDVLRLRKQGLSYKEIINEIEKSYGDKLSKSTVSYWCRGVHSPYNVRRIPSIEFLKPSPELAYIIGTVIGDGFLKIVKKKRKGYNEVYIELETRDLDFAEEFGRCLGVVLNRQPPKPRYRRTRNTYVVSVKDKTLFELLRGRELEKLRPFIEYNEECKKMFLRGFFDSEGCVSKYGNISCCNANYELLKYVHGLLNDLGIQSTVPHPYVKKETPIICPRTGRIYRRKKDVYYIYIRRSSLPVFYQKVNFTIIRKRRILEEYLRGRGLLK